MTITLRDEDLHFIESAIKAGRYASKSEAVSDAILELRGREQPYKSRVADIRAKVMVGIDQLDRGEGADWNVEEIKSKGRASLNA